MKMIKEVTDEQNKQSLNINNKEKLEPKELSSNSKDINDLNAGLSNLNLCSDQSQSVQKEVSNVNKELVRNKKLELEDNNINTTIKNNDNLGKENLNISSQKKN